MSFSLSNSRKVFVLKRSLYGTINRLNRWYIDGICYANVWHHDKMNNDCVNIDRIV